MIHRPRRAARPAPALVALALAALAQGAAARADDAAGAFTVEPDVVYARPEGAPLRLDAYLPEGAGPFPAALVIHGGSWRSGSKGQLAFHARGLARAGIAAFAIDYRLAPAHVFPAQLEDCRAAVGFVRSEAARFRVDGARLGALGYSAGGHLALLLGLGAVPGEPPPPSATARPAGDLRVAAVVAGGAPCDFRDMRLDSGWLAYWLGGTRRERPDAYRDASPLAYPAEAAPPVLFYHGEADALVPLAGPERLRERLRAAGGTAELIKVPLAGHMGAAVHPAALERSIEFLREHLGRRPRGPEVF